MPTTQEKPNQKSKTAAVDTAPRMSCTVMRDDFARAVAEAASVSKGARGASDFYEYADLIATEDGSLVIECSDGEVWIRRTIPASVFTPGRCNVLAKTLSDVAKKLPSGDIDVDALSGDTPKLQLKQGSSNYTVVGKRDRDPITLPVVGEAKSSFTMLADDIDKLIGGVAFAVSSDSHRQILTGVLLTSDGQKLTAVATDTHRLAVNAIDRACPPFSMVIFNSGLNAFRSLAIPGDQEVEIVIAGSRAYFQAPDTLVIVSAAAGVYPNWERVVPNDLTREWTVASDVFSESLKRALMFGRDSANRVTLSIFEEMLSVHSRSPEKGEAWVRCDFLMPVEGDHKMAFNGKYLLDGMSNSPDGENAVVIHSGQPNRPAIMRRRGVEGWFYVLMPMTSEDR